MDQKDNIEKDKPVDEKMVMSIMAEGVRKPGQLETVKEQVKEPEIQKSVVQEKGRSRKLLDTTYKDRFLNNHSMTRRGDKSIYIKQEYHERLSRIVQVIGHDNIPLYAYLDNILEHHFELFEKAITDDFNENYKPIF